MDSKKPLIKKLTKDKGVLLLLIISFLFLVIKVPQLGFKFSDENIYFYMGHLLLQGSLPYSDFFFASPPIQLIVISPFLALTSKIILLKLIPLIASIITTALLFLTVREKFDKTSALASSAFFLFSFVVLTTTDHLTGIHLTTMFTIASFYAVNREKYFLGGIIGSLALLTRLYAAFALMGICLYLLIKNRKTFLNYLAGIAVVFIPVNLALTFLLGKLYTTPVFVYHFLKSEGISKFRIMSFFLKWDFLLIAIPAISLFLKDRKKLLFAFVPAAVILLFYIFYADIYYLYLGLLVPFLAVISGVSLPKIIKKITSNTRNIIAITAVILILLLSYNSFYYIQGHSQTAKIDFAQDMAHYVKQNSRTSDTIYGSFEITPLIALLADRQIINNYIDTNEKTFLSGIYSVEERTEKLKGKVKFVIMKVLMSQNKILSIENIVSQDFLANDCEVVKIYPIKADYSSNAVLLFEC